MKPPSKIPEELMDAFTMGGKIPVVGMYVDGTEGEKHETVLDMMDKMFKSGQVKSNYPMHDEVLRELLPVELKKKGKWLVVGSARPFYETLLLMGGAEKVDVWEIKGRDSGYPGLRYLGLEDLKGNVYDNILAISSVEHFGLGRYGDTLDPDGDLKAMRAIREMMSENGVVFLTVPCGKDRVIFNLHRIYGEIRLRKLLEGFHFRQYVRTSWRDGEETFFVLTK
jgi:hypothetical protein